MRRIFSIPVIAALVCSWFSPLWAATCETTGKRSACHRENHVVHHCDMMGHHHAADMESTETALSSGVSKCPMDCCSQIYSANGTAPARGFTAPLQLVTSYEFHRAAVVFASPGFSSHTDRGPPRA
ncbi:MAG: hypothetical protein DMG65_19875 [Candidatus Angelobacter sp. Gp1-AA117]|nr:MAG: hypothetical protein DMG65_19875 [Candidatus Angelobacter sp. Gp1-AA117]